jgi:hypothetical protein
MQVLAHRQNLLFTNQNGGEHFSLEPKPTIQTAPDWIRETGTFQHAIKAGLVTELNVVGPAAPQPEPAAAVDVPGLSGNRPAPRRPKAKAA